MTQGATELEVHQRVLDYLRQHQKLTLATASQTGIPRATTLMYVNDGVTFYVWTHPESTVARHVSQNPFVSLAIDDYSPNWRETKGIQATGDCTLVVKADEIARSVGLYEEKFSSLSGSAGNVSFSASSRRTFDSSRAQTASSGSSRAGGERDRLPAHLSAGMVLLSLRRFSSPRSPRSSASERQPVEVIPLQREPIRDGLPVGDVQCSNFAGAAS